MFLLSVGVGCWVLLPRQAVYDTTPLNLWKNKTKEPDWPDRQNTLCVHPLSAQVRLALYHQIWLFGCQSIVVNFFSKNWYVTWKHTLCTYCGGLCKVWAILQIYFFLHISKFILCGHLDWIFLVWISVGLNSAAEPFSSTACALQMPTPLKMVLQILTPNCRATMTNC